MTKPLTKGQMRAAMTEKEWLTCNGPKKMFQFIKPKASPRQLRLLACGCCRHFWHLYPDERSRRAVEVAEQYADGLATEEVTFSAWEAAYDVKRERWGGDEAILQDWAEGSPSYDPFEDDCTKAAGIFGKGETENASLIVTNAPHAKRVVLANLLRDIFGNPFRPQPTIKHSWLIWQSGTVKTMAQAIYDDNQFADMPMLADALEEAGCSNTDILNHLRGPAPHCRGCWALDLVLGK